MKKFVLIFTLFFPSVLFAQIEHEFSPLVSFYTGDALRSSILGSFSYTLHLNDTYWVGLDSLFGSPQIDVPNGFGLSSDENLTALNGSFYLNLPALLGAKKKGDDGFATDLYTSVGLGYFWLGSQEHLFGFWGGGMLLRTGWRWLAFRFDLKGYFFQLSNTQGSDFNSDLAISLGPTFLF